MKPVAGGLSFFPNWRHTTVFARRGFSCLRAWANSLGRRLCHLAQCPTAPWHLGRVCSRCKRHGSGKVQVSVLAFPPSADAPPVPIHVLKGQIVGSECNKTFKKRLLYWCSFLVTSPHARSRIEAIKAVICRQLSRSSLLHQAETGQMKGWVLFDAEYSVAVQHPAARLMRPRHTVCGECLATTWSADRTGGEVGVVSQLQVFSGDSVLELRERGLPSEICAGMLAACTGWRTGPPPPLKCQEASVAQIRR